MLQFRDELAQRLALPSGKKFPDPNNNGNGPTTLLKTMGTGSLARGEKYQLRPRSSIRNSKLCDPDDEIQQKSPNPPEQETQIQPAVKLRQTKPKQKPAPLSKYRRKTANARERSRMREINTAFEALRRAVPHIFVSQCPINNNGLHGLNAAQAPSEKLTKITTLRLAMRYISALSAVLNNCQQQNSTTDLDQHQSKLDFIDSSSPNSSRLSVCSSVSSTISNQSSNQHLKQEFKLDLDTLLMESSDAESLCTLSDNSFPLSSTDQPLTPLTFDDNPLTDSAVYFGDQTLSLDFTDNSLSGSPDFSETSPFDQFLPHFS